MEPNDCEEDSAAGCRAVQVPCWERHKDQPVMFNSGVRKLRLREKV